MSASSQIAVLVGDEVLVSAPETDVVSVENSKIFQQGLW
jgi:chemotaxis protein CheY-P-specific phosphatase CheC